MNFTLLFAFFLLINLLLKLWLANRQLRHVAPHREQAPTDFAESISLPTHQKAADYTLAKLRLGHWDLAIDALVLLGWTLLGGLSLLDQWLLGLIGPGMLQQLALVVGFMLITGALNLPISYYQTFHLEQRFGFNNMTVGLWLSDLVKSTLVGAVLGMPLIWAVLQLMQSGGSVWWLWAWALLVAYQLFVMWIAPNFIMPLFNKFTPMPEGELKQEIEALGVKCGFPLSGVFVMDGSKRSTKANAFFTGLGKRKKIALFDTLVEKSSTPELLGVLAHEIGHFRCGHIKQRLAVGILQTAVIFYLLGLATDPDGKFARLLFDAFGVREISPHVGLVLFSILLEPVSKALGVLAHAWSRRHEFEADAYAAKVTGNGAALGEALKKMTSDHLSHPSPAALRVWLDYSHPPLARRLEALRNAN